MSKRWVILMLGLILGFLLARQADAAWPWQKTATATNQSQAAPAKEQVKAAAPAQEKPKVAAPAKAPEIQAASLSSADLEKQRQMREKKKSMLNNNMWDIDVMPLSGKGAKQADSIIFRDNKFSSDLFGRMGVGPSNFTLTVQDDGSSVVETMQSGEKEGIIFWRVEFDREMAGCRGIYSRQLGPNKTEDYSFVSTAKKPAMSAPPAAAAASVPVAAAPAPESKQGQAPLKAQPPVNKK